MAILRSHGLGFSVGFAVLISLCNGGALRAQALSHQVHQATLAQLDRAVCLQQWGQAIDITSRLIASPDVSMTYRQELLRFRRQLQTWQITPVPPITQASCDRTLPLFLPLAEPEAPEPQPLDWYGAIAALRSSRPIIELDDDFDPTVNLIPPELTASSPEVLADFASPIDTTDGFNVVGGRVNRGQQVYSFVARLGDRLSLEADVTRTHIGGETQIFLFDQTGHLLMQSNDIGFQVSMQNVVIPKTDVYFAVVSPQGTTPILDSQGLIVGWQTQDANSSFDYTLTLTGVTPYQALLLP
ncbi:hypothetical protein IQ260_19155 [Leptolyngbya cf. ectocarpi LEGE 11479]|uniref:Uncharacterized protein n=1 Tax=Leptolyngbya cf. ectocarpi LEGE 11479 TaxID=1828722 RepID=A0A929FB20_LEPEC|nr:hypothetical protein [Leptolyngbya ectocarpi]MBE9068767.1 hypothetical protein [Leptolyngbya cf. ectocarpi LEGE 11479]